VRKRGDAPRLSVDARKRERRSFYHLREKTKKKKEVNRGYTKEDWGVERFSFCLEKEGKKAFIAFSKEKRRAEQDPEGKRGRRGSFAGMSEKGKKKRVVSCLGRKRGGSPF